MKTPEQLKEPFAAWQRRKSSCTGSAADVLFERIIDRLAASSFRTIYFEGRTLDIINDRYW